MASCTIPVTSGKVRCSSQRRYVAVVETATGGYIAKRSDDLTTIREHARKAWGRVYDTVERAWI